MQGLRSYRQRQEVSFKDLGLFAITGRTGAGKSSLLEALVFALYHATTFDKRSVTSLISDGAEDLTVSLEFVVLGERWQVTRSISRANRQPVHELRGLDTGERLDRKSEVDERIVALLGLSCDDFLKTVVLPQGQFQALLQSSPGDRAPLLKNLLGLDQLDKLAESVARQRERLALAVQQAQGRRQALPENPGEGLALARQRLLELTAAEELLAAQAQSAELREREGRNLQREAEAAGRQLESVAGLTLPEPAELLRLDALETELAGAATELQATLEHHTRRLAELEARQLAELPRWRDRWQALELGRQVLGGEREGLLALQSAASAEAAELRELRAAAEARQQELAELQSRGQVLAASVEAARQELAAHRQAVARRRETEETHARRLRVMQDLREELTGLEVLLESRQSEAQRAAEALREAERANLVAVLCAEHQGSGCPVCERPLPEQWQAPVAPDLAAVREASRSAGAAAGELDARTQQTRGGLAALGEELARLEADLAAEPPADLEERELALATLEARHKQLQEDWLGLHRECERGLATAAEKERHLERSRQEAARLEGRCVRREAELVLEEAELAQLLELPSLDGAEARLEELEAQAREHASERDACRQALLEAHRRSSELAARRQSEVERPRRAAEALLAAARALLDALGAPAAEELEFDAERLARADGSGAVDELAGDGGRAVEQARAPVELGLSASRRWLARRRDALQLALTTRAAELASQLAQHLETLEGQDSAAALRTRWVEAREERALQSRTVEQCESALAEATRLDEVLEPARRRWRQLEFLHEALGNRRGKGRLSFSQWLLEQRQQELLVLASRTFAQMSSGQYGFSAQFQVVDRASGQTRKPNTLSGGESFLASLSLALALSELVGRRGGRLEAFFLDEGFGTLSPEALDRALDALEQLASSGRMIGVISHVGLVAERIEKVLHVTRTPEGSRLEDLQPHHRARLARQEVYDSAEHPLLALAVNPGGSGPG